MRRMQMMMWLVVFLCVVHLGNAFIVISPANLTTYHFTPLLATFSAPPIHNYTGELVFVGLACSPLNATEVTGKVALIDRGACAFLDKAYNAQDAGAIAMVLIDTGDGAVMLGTGDITIVCEAIPNVEGVLLKQYMEEGPVVVTVLQTPMVPNQLQVLLDLWTVTSGPEWNYEDNTFPSWNLSNDPCQYLWTGVGCGVLSGELTFLELSSFGLKGPLPDLSAFRSLTSLSVQFNEVYGTFPDWVCQLTNLTLLDLGNNQFTGTIPSCLGSLTKLTQLILSGNSFSGTIPEEIFGLTELTELSINSNKFTGTLSPAINSLTKLQTFNFRDNLFSGDLPAYDQLVELIEMDISNNNLTGTIPNFLNGLINLMALDISNNQFHGALPDMYDMSGMINLDISRNQFSGELPFGDSLPPNIKYFYASRNQYTTINPLFSQSITLLSIDISHNQIEVSDIYLVAALPRPSQLALLNGNCLEFIDVSYNKIYNEAKYSSFLLMLSNWPNLVAISMNNNNLDKTIKLSTNNDLLRTIDLSNNKIPGEIPSRFSDLPSLQTLVLVNNEFRHPANTSFIPTTFYTDYMVTEYYPSYNFSCPSIHISGSDALVTLDPAYHGYELCKCEPGFRRVSAAFTAEKPFNFYCLECPSMGMTCPGRENDTSYTIHALYWPTPSLENPIELIECSNCNPSDMFFDGPMSVNHSIEFPCKEHHLGRLCSRCDNHSYNRGTGCAICSPVGTIAVVASVLILVIVVVTCTSCTVLQGQFCRSCIKRARKSTILTPQVSTSSFTPQTGSASPATTPAKRKKRRKPAQAPITIVINYYQTVSALSQYFKLPVSVDSLLGTMQVLTSVTGSGIGIQCLHHNLHEFRFYYLAIMLEPPMALAFILVGFLIGKAIYLAFPSTRKSFLLRDWGVTCTRLALFTINFLFFPIVSTAINAFRCQADPVTDVDYVRSFPYAECSEVPTVAKVMSILVYGGGTVALFGTLVLLYRKNPDQHGFIFRSFDFFLDPYRSKYIHFSVLILLRRFVISILISLIRVDSALSFGLNNLILFSSLISIMYYRPFKTDIDNKLEIATTIVLIYAYALALVMGTPSLHYGASTMQVFYFIVNIFVILWCLYETGRAHYPHVVPIIRTIFGLPTNPPSEAELTTTPSQNTLNSSQSSSSPAFMPDSPASSVGSPSASTELLPSSNRA